MELFTITNVYQFFFHLEYIIDVVSFWIRSVVDIIQELFQVKEFFMEHLNNFNIIAGIQNFTEILKSKDIFLPIQHLNTVKCAVTLICVCPLIYKHKEAVPNNPPSLIIFRKLVIKLF